MVPGQLDEAARAEEAASALAPQETVDDAPDELSYAEDRSWHRSEVLHAVVGDDGILI
jgi:hypothetical protein